MKDDYVRVKDYIPDIYEDLRYATKRNFTHTKVYDFDEAYLRRGTTFKLKKVQEELKGLGYSLKSGMLIDHLLHNSISGN